MAAWITVYWRRAFAGDLPEQIQRCVDEADWMSLAESYGIESERTVLAALRQFRIERLEGRSGEAYCLYYRPDRPRGCRQIELERWTEPALVKQEVTAARASLRGNRTVAARRIRTHLAKVRETVAFELGWDQLESIAVVFAYEIARWLAQCAGGWIEDHEDRWWAVTRRGHLRHV